MPQLKAVIFDLSGVIKYSQSTTSYWRKLESERDLPEGSIKKTLLSNEFAAISYDLFTGYRSAEEIENDEFIRLYNRMHKTNTEPLPVIRNWFGEGTSAIEMDSNVVEAIDALREAEIKVALLTNNYYLDKAKTQRRLPSDISRFDVVVESCVEGVMKPHAKLYEIALDRLSLRANECVFVDSHQVHTDTAKALGFRSIFARVCDREWALCELEDILNEDAMSDEAYESDSTDHSY
uniref:HAD family hydrolase n=1 Tax=Panagrellus redivivus TaxID=6233 RepID=A0A7E4VFD0_PANRE